MFATTTRPEPAATRRRLRTPILLAIALGTASVLIAWFDPRVNHVPLCPSRAVTGLDCPFCGGLRSVTSLVRGQIGDALSYNLLVTLAIPIAVLAWALWIWRTRRGQTLTAPAWLQPAAWSVAIAFAVLRNLPAFSWLHSGG